MSSVATPPRADIQISAPRLGPDVERLVLEVLRSGRLAQGPMVERLEHLCADVAGARHAVALSSGTAALDAALAAHGVGPGDEVVTTPLTFAATVNAVLRAGATVRFADVGDDFTVDAAAVERLLGPRTRALLPVHLYGLMADVHALGAMARERGLVLVEDAAQALGAACAGTPAGATGTAAFSFYATKNVTSGEGGCLTTDDDDVAERVRTLRNQGMRERYEYVAIGNNWRMTEVAAAIAIPQLERVHELNAARRANAAVFHALLRDDERLTLPAEPPGRTHAWHQYTVLVAEGIDRDATVRTMAEAGVHAGVYYPRLVWDHAAYRGDPRVVPDPTPRAEAVARRCLSLPVHPALTETDLVRVAETLQAALP